MTDRVELAKFQDDLQVALRSWWHMDGRHGMTATEMIPSLLGALDRHGFRIDRQAATALSAEGGAHNIIAGVIARLTDELNDRENVDLGDLANHGMNCPALTPSEADQCRCGLKYRRMLATERSMHRAWRKRAEEAESRLSPSADLVAAALADGRNHGLEGALVLCLLKEKMLRANDEDYAADEMASLAKSIAALRSAGGE